MPSRVPQPKRQAADEAARTLRIYDMLDEELRGRPIQLSTVSPDAALKAAVEARMGILTVAERIAARTEN